MVCAITMACGVNKSPHSPSGPERDNVRKTARPTTTGGRPIIALSATMTPSRPGNRVSAMTAPSGTPMRAASSTALMLTMSDSLTMANRPGSPVRTKCSADPSPVISVSEALWGRQMLKSRCLKVFSYFAPLFRNRSILEI